MLKLFSYDNTKKEAVINEADILLIKEFAALFLNERNITKQDPTGKNKTKAFREFTYIYCAIDWNSPYSKYSEQERHENALSDGRLTQEEFDDEIFRQACRKYKAIQEESIVGSLLKSYYNTISKMKIELDNMDLGERDINGKPIWKAKDIMAEIASAGKMLDGIQLLEEKYKTESEKENSLRGGREGGKWD